MIGLGLGLGLSNNAGGVEKMTVRKITLIDGQFFKQLCDYYKELVGFDFFPNLNWTEVSMGAARTYFYDSLPAKRGNQSEAEFETEYQSKIAELDFIRSQRWYHVKDGVSRYRKKDKRREQKGVDILLAIDAVQMAAQGLADEITILTSDTDFFPVFELMNQTRCRGILRYQRGKTSEELIYAADQASPIEISELARWCAVGDRQTNSIFPKMEKTITLPNDDEFTNRKSETDASLVFDERNREYVLYTFQNNFWHKTVSENPYLIFELAHLYAVHRYPYTRLSEFVALSH